jgi:gliding motility-associated-like protein
VCGTFKGTADFDPSLAVYNLTASGLSGQADCFIAKYSSSGTFIWAVKAGGVNQDNANRIYIDANYLYIAGSYSGSATFYSTSNTTKNTTASQSGINFFGAKYNLNGVVQWVVTAGSSGTDEGLDVVADNAAVYFTGSYENNLTVYNSSGSTATNIAVQTSGKSDAFVLSFDQAGSYNWLANISSTEEDTGNGITQDANNIYVTGSIKANASFPYPSPAFTQACLGGMDIYLASISKANGAFQWISSQTGSANGDEIAYEIALDNNSNLVMTGYFKNNLNFAPFGGSNFQTFGGEDIFLSAYNTSGNFLWAKQAGDNGRDIPYGLSPGVDGVFTGGEYADAAAFGNIILNNDAGKNMFVGKTGCAMVSGNSISSSQTICPGNAPQQLSGSSPTGGAGPGTYTFSWQSSTDNISWTTAAGNSTLQNYNPSQITSDTWFKRIVNSVSGCQASISNTIMVSMAQAPGTANAGSDLNVCSTLVQLNAVNPLNGSGKWMVLSGGGVITNTGSANTYVNNLSPGANQFIWMVSNGTLCPSNSDTVLVMRYMNPTVANAGADQSVCGSSLNLSANVPASGNGIWTVFSGNGNFSNVHYALSQINNLSPGINKLVWTISNGTCPPSSDTILVSSFLQPVNVFAGNDQKVCSDNAILHADSSNAGSGAWSIVSGSGTISNTLSNQSEVNNLIAGDNVLRWTVTNGICPQVFDEVLIHRDLPPDDALAGPDQSIDKPESFLSAAQPSVGNGSWMLVSGEGKIEVSTDAKTKITALAPGENIFRWTVHNGVCSDKSDDITVYVRPLNIPNAFSPNGDGYNDSFVIPNIEYYDNVKFRVFNRWGGEVFSSDSYRNNWKGTNMNNEKLSDDTYYFTVELSPKNNYNGFVVLKQNK